MSTDFDVAVVGAGFGGLGAAMRLAERGVRVVVLERLRYPGGCACTFDRAGYKFDAGATLSSGLDDDQLFGRWRRTHGLDFADVPLDPVMSLRAPGLEIDTGADKRALIDRLCTLSPEHGTQIRAFFEAQSAVADALWPLLEDPGALPPFRFRALARTARHLPRFLRAARWVGRPLSAVLAHYRLEGCAPLRLWLDALCQITVQCSVEEAEAPVAMSAIDYAWRGTGHVEGGIGQLAWALWRGIGALGGELRPVSGVRHVEREGDGWALSTRTGPLRARAVVFNRLPQDAQALVRGHELKVSPLESSWGAITHYLGLRLPEGAPQGAHHLQLIADASRPLIEGNHVFASLSGATEGRAPAGQRALTLSTHIDAAALARASDREQAERVSEVQAHMLQTLKARAPELAEDLAFDLPGSPRTFARFTGRDRGFVGGPPKRASWSTTIRPREHRLGDGLYLVGDSVLLGQSTYACALGGVRVADEILSRA